MAATIANLTLLAGQTGLTSCPAPQLSVFTVFANDGVCPRANWRGNLVWTLVDLTPTLRPRLLFQNRVFRLNF
jgi:hypothetical protein